MSPEAECILKSIHLYTNIHTHIHNLEPVDEKCECGSARHYLHTDNESVAENYNTLLLLSLPAALVLNMDKVLSIS